MTIPIAGDSDGGISKLPSRKFFARRGLIQGQKGLHEFAFATNSHARKAFEPAALRDGGLSIQPSGQQSQLIGLDVAEPDAVEQMFEYRARKIGAANLRHQAWLLAP